MPERKCGLRGRQRRMQRGWQPPPLRTPAVWVFGTRALRGGRLRRIPSTLPPPMPPLTVSVPFKGASGSCDEGRQC